MPRKGAVDWSGWTLEAADLPAGEKALLSHHFRLRAMGLRNPGVVRREEKWLVRFACILRSKGRDLCTATETDALELTEQFERWGWGASQSQQCVAALRALYRGLVDIGRIERDPFRRIRLAKAEYRMPRVLGPEEIDRLLTLYDPSDWREVRDNAVLCFLASTGARVSEACGLDGRSLALERAEAIVLGKGGKERVVFLDPRAVASLRRYLAFVRPMLAKRKSSGAIFLGRQGGPLHHDVVRAALERAASRANIPRHLWPHLMRHSFASDLVEKGADLRAVQVMMGHVDPRTTARYAQVSPKRLRKVYDETHHGGPEATGRAGEA